jgi:hypothetical protein
MSDLWKYQKGVFVLTVAIAIKLSRCGNLMTDEELKLAKLKIADLVIEIGILEIKKQDTVKSYSNVIKVLKEDVDKYCRAIEAKDMTIINGY